MFHVSSLVAATWSLRIRKQTAVEFSDRAYLPAIKSRVQPRETWIGFSFAVNVNLLARECAVNSQFVVQFGTLGVQFAIAGHGYDWLKTHAGRAFWRKAVSFRGRLVSQHSSLCTRFFTCQAQEMQRGNGQWFVVRDS